jgi:hypothetical protein
MLSGGPLPDFIALFLGALAFGIPFYCAALLVLHNATNSILRHPLTWCVGIPAALLAATLLTFPPFLWIVLIPLSALLAGALFYLWLRRSPLPAHN